MRASSFRSIPRPDAALDRIVLAAVVLMAGMFPAEVFPVAPRLSNGIDGEYSGRQGQIVLVKVPADDGGTQVQGRFLGRTISFFQDSRPEEPKGFVGLLGIDMQDEPGTHPLTVTLRNGEQTRILNYSIVVAKEQFRVEHLKLPKEKVDLDEQSLARWKSEQQLVQEALAEDSQIRLWQPGFVEPVNGKRTGIFGSVRIMNGQPRNPHNGEDIGAPLGTEVAATNDGVVRLAVEHVFSGKGIYLDHGLGFYSMYFHLSDVLVKEGETVKAGQVIGKVGATGRATGPHLHWGVKLNGARVNPYALLDLPFKGAVQSAAPASVAEPASAVGAPAP
jgi:murein DD-endopeptidase MepM/ murein hydrolase activator NlpD